MSEQIDIPHARWCALMNGTNETGPHLTPEEIAAGWHFCIDWDGLLIGPGMGELESCHCIPKTGA